jgi:hypothetical protein
MQCASVRKKGSEDQCPAKCLRGLTLCGRHARCKNTTLWAEVHKKRGDAMIRAQALVRGWLIRRRLGLAGPGVLCRKKTTNDEDLVSYESKDKVNPFEYFAFTENGKVWWFEFSTLWKWCARSHEPINPYTKVPVDNETLKRLHASWSYRYRHKLPLPEEPTHPRDRLHTRWNIVCALFSNYGFGAIEPRMFEQMSKMQYYTMFRFISDDIQIVMSDRDPYKEFILRMCLRAQQCVHALQTDLYVLQSTYTLLLLLLRPKDPYVLAFTVLSALYRV